MNGVFFQGDHFLHSSGTGVVVGGGSGGGSGGGGSAGAAAVSGGVPFGSNMTTSEVTSWWSHPSEPVCGKLETSTQDWL